MPSSQSNARQRSEHLESTSQILECAALFISDIHLGSNQSQAKLLSKFLKLVRPDILYLVGDIIDLRAIKLNGNIDDRFLTQTIDKAIEEARVGLINTDLIRRRKLLRKSHLRVLEDLHILVQNGTRVKYIPGNHDSYFRKYHGLEWKGFSIIREDIYQTPDGRRLLVKHGDEFDLFIQMHSRISRVLTRIEERYSGIIQSFRLAQDILFSRTMLTQQQNPHETVQAAAVLLAQHFDLMNTGSEKYGLSDFSLAFALEQAIKTHTDHDRVFKTCMVQSVFNVNTQLYKLRLQGIEASYLDGVVTGHTHIPEATAFESPSDALGASIGPCHITYYNDGSWARSQMGLGRTALLVDKNGRTGMIRFDRTYGIVPHQPSLFSFNTYPTRPCTACGTMTVMLTH